MIRTLSLTLLATAALVAVPATASAVPGKCALMKSPETVKVCNPGAESAGDRYVPSGPSARTYENSGTFTLRDRDGNGFKEWGLDPR